MLHLAKNKQILIFLGVYTLIRVLSFNIINAPHIQTLIAVLIVITLIYTTLRSPIHGWYILIGELLLGGTGHFVELSIGSLSLAIRTILIYSFIGTFFIKQYTQKNIRLPRPLLITMLIPIIISIYSALVGLLHGHETTAIIQDLIPYTFFLLIFPTYLLLKQYAHSKTIKTFFYTFIIGTSIFAIFTFILFALGIAEPQDPTYYRWFRDIIAGKVTPIGHNFFRIVEPIHLWLTPIIIYLAANIIKGSKNKTNWIFLILLSFPFMMNFSRGYMLGLAAGLLFLLLLKQPKKWLYTSLAIGIMFFSSFTLMHLTTSKGASPGWDLFGIRISSIVRPETEVSALTRKTLLPPIIEKIKEHPFIGHGLGASLTFTDPLTNTIVTTRQFDWGYLELLVELGFIGTLLFMGSILYTIKIMYKKMPYNKATTVAATLISILVITITAPALFHTIGVLYLVYIHVTPYVFTKQDKNAIL
ncbi:MAG: hypothetical protein HN726_02260 [Candidatus Magasanikbacteria bacterium]|jgi:hypothetical protein|nr:hypothetical protein [Candidatus Magasanikbacteria bacterium]MBT4221393.1 hypothetical protein [Candidatus Magasanikbacteria bacterium]MBT4350759.1 hypothetical protein [Candidatus Magasanikbacteria bacterium]MBT4541565.1 hypothetical protein [Candidatus Magasanikbacteria bacterium]MBT6253517.1 hypothetical protein [Candidatus Magasanikbacteria bacterium]